MRQIKIVDLFAGPGGLGEGFSSLRDKDGKFPFKLVVSVEKEQSAHETLTLRAFLREFPGRTPPVEYYRFLRGEMSKSELYRAYPERYQRAQQETLYQPRELGKPSDDKFINESIGRALGSDKEWVLIGGPPCQAYSLVGRARNLGNQSYKAEEDHRHFLYREYLRIINTFKPSMFVMENVKGILSSKVGGSSVFAKILDDLSGAGYTIDSFSSAPSSGDMLDQKSYAPKDYIIRMERYGVPQKRHRVILFGVRNDLATSGLSVLEPVDPVTAFEAIGDLPKLRSGVSKSIDSAENWKEIVRRAHVKLGGPAKSASWPYVSKHGRGEAFIERESACEKLRGKLLEFIRDDSLQGVINHDTRAHMKEDIARYYFASTFARSSKTNAKLADYPDWLQPDHANRHTGKFVDRFKVQLANEPSSTITSHISKDGHYYIHYDPLQCRSLTVREAARLQTFPDNYYFCGTRTQQYVQVGNAVPPFLALQLAKLVHERLLTQRRLANRRVESVPN